MQAKTHVDMLMRGLFLVTSSFGIVGIAITIIRLAQKKDIKAVQTMLSVVSLIIAIVTGWKTFTTVNLPPTSTTANGPTSAPKSESTYVPTISPKAIEKTMEILHIETIKNLNYEYSDINDKNTTYSIDFPLAIFGEYLFSWELTEQEKQSLRHSGELFRDNGEKVENINFWANSEGVFAAGIPKDLLPGTYSYILNLYVDDVEFSDTVSFYYGGISES